MPQRRLSVGDGTVLFYMADTDAPPLEPGQLPPIKSCKRLEASRGLRNRLSLKLSQTHSGRTEAIIAIRRSYCTKSTVLPVPPGTTFGRLKKQLIDYVEGFYDALADQASNPDVRRDYLEDSQVLRDRLARFTRYDEAVIPQPAPS